MLDWRAVEDSMVLSLKFHMLLLTYAVHLPQHRDVSYQALLLEPSSTFQVIWGHCFVSEGNTHTDTTGRYGMYGHQNLRVCPWKACHRRCKEVHKDPIGGEKLCVCRMMPNYSAILTILILRVAIRSGYVFLSVSLLDFHISVKHLLTCWKHDKLYWSFVASACHFGLRGWKIPTCKNSCYAMTHMS